MRDTVEIVDRRESKDTLVGCERIVDLGLTV